MDAMRSGRMRDRVTLQTQVNTRSASGEVTWSWEDVCGEQWAEVIPMKGALRFQAAQLGEGQPFTVYIHYQDGVRPTQRFAWQPECDATQYLEIDSVGWDTRRTYLELICFQRSNDGYRNEK